jgi:uncharacterized RDD family membrane protein YckC
MAAAAEGHMVLAGFGRRMLSLVYDSLLVFAVAFLAALAYLAVVADPHAALERHLFQAYLFVVLGAYFVLCWRRGGGTLAMHTWKLRLVRSDGGPVGPIQAWVRYAIAWPSIALFGAGLLWALVDRDGQFLHDRLARTRVVLDPGRRGGSG